MSENWVHYWACDICGRIFPQNEPGAIIGTDISCCSSIICRRKFTGVTLSEWREFKKTKKYATIFGCDPDEKILGLSHIYSPETGMINVIGSTGEIVAEYIIC